MSKFYIQSGNFRTVVSADDAEKAALWVVHRTMQQVMPVFDDDQPKSAKLGRSSKTDKIMILGAKILVSEVGFESNQFVQLDTLEVQCHWQQLVMALAKLETLVECASESNGSLDKRELAAAC